MTDSKERYTITAALPYTNGPIHIGHLAGVYIPADIYSRYLRAIGKDIIFICGSDEHGVAISIKAKKENKTPKEIIDKYNSMIKDAFEKFDISFDNYSRTSKKIHHETASDFFKNLYSKNVFIEKESEQLYDNEAKQFLADRFVKGICPICNEDEAYGDQCESCGSSLSANELIDPKSTISNSKPILKKTKHWYLPLNKYEKFISKWILEGHKKDWKINVYGQVKSWIDNGLKERAVTRDLDWGIPIPIDNEKGKVLYVWFDAPIGYISSTKEWAKNNGKNWEPYWKSDKTKLIHFIGKDNIVFHCIIFPIILKESSNYILPYNVPANEFLNLEGKKISTSKNWAVWLHEYLEDLPEREDLLRYVLTSNAPESKDNDFTWKDFQARNNNELVSIYGNFVNRVIVLIHKYFDGKVPSFKNLNKKDSEILKLIKQFPEKIGKKIEEFKFREASQNLINLSRLGNKYLAEQEPWKLVKTEMDKVENIMYVAIQVTAYLSILSGPFLPFSSKKLKSLLNLSETDIKWNDLININEIIKPGHIINKPELLFKKIKDEEIDYQITKLNEKSTIENSIKKK
jgi:methionyl-tRNA synthetase